MDLNEEDARDHLRLMEDEYGANDGACIELRDGTPTSVLYESDVAEVLYYGESEDYWDGTSVAVLKLKDGRLVAWQTWWGPTGNGFGLDAYGGDTKVYFAQDLRLLVNEVIDE